MQKLNLKNEALNEKLDHQPQHNLESSKTIDSTKTAPKNLSFFESNTYLKSKYFFAGVVIGVGLLALHSYNLVFSIL